MPCSKTYRHDWRVCPYAHAGETAARRHPKLHSYVGVICPDTKKVLVQLYYPFRNRRYRERNVPEEKVVHVRTACLNIGFIPQGNDATCRESKS